MPTLDGLAVARAIRCDPATASIPIVLLTALGQRSAAKRAARDCGIDAYLSKPVRVDRLEACLCALLVRESSSPRSRRPAPGPPTPAVPRARILVAEDDATSRKVVRRLLEKRGHRVDTVGDGRSAVDACLRRVYDLVFMDCRLPELDGFQAALEIRRREPSTRRTPIVALTASLTPDRRQRCFEVGMGGYLSKPLHTDELDATLARWLSPERPPIESPLTEPDVLDAVGLLDRVDGDVAFVRELLAGLRRDGPRWLAHLEDALARGDRAAVEQIAHAIRGATSNLGGLRVAAAAARLEDEARRDAISDGPWRVGEIAAELDRLLAALDALGSDRAAAS